MDLPVSINLGQDTDTQVNPILHTLLKNFPLTVHIVTNKEYIELSTSYLHGPPLSVASKIFQKL